MTKEEIQKNSEHWYNKYKEVKHELEQERKLNAEIKARFVKCNTCTDEMKSKCLMFSENLCEGERCNQLLKDKGYLTDKLQELKEILAQTIENDEVAYETLKLHDQEEIGMLKSRVAELEQQIEQMKCCPNCDFVFRDGNCYYDKECKNKDHWKLRR